MLAILVRKSENPKPRVFQFGLMWGLAFFVAWLGIQTIWALDGPTHFDFFVLYFKFLLLIVLIYRCIDTIAHFKIFLWTHATGCFYLGTVVLSAYVGGRFEGFRGPGINEANAAALIIATGVVTTFALFLAGKVWEKIVAIGFMPVTLNGIIATISRSGFLALIVSGVIFNLFSPKKIIGTVRAFSLAGLLLLVLIANPVYWERIETVFMAGEEVEGVDTGSSRLVIMRAQFEMFSQYPMGCGHRCTAVLSPAYLEERYLSPGPDGTRSARSSHNSFMSLLVEQGVPGAVVYLCLLGWMASTIFRLRSPMRDSIGLVPIVYVATVSILGAITVGDLFVDYLKFEVRFWFLGVLMVLVKLEAKRQLGESRQLEHAVERPVEVHRQE